MNTLPLSAGDVDRLKSQCRHCNVFPIFLPHYYPPENGHPVGVVLAKLIDESVGCLKAMTIEEITSLVDSLHPSLKMLLDFDPTQPIDDHVLQRVAMHYLMGVADQGYISFKDALFPDIQKSAVLLAYPELASAFDDEGLLMIDGRFQAMEWGVVYRDHVLHYHQCLRRGFSSNPNFDFISRFLRYRHQAPQCTFRIAIDHNRLMPLTFLERICEMDTWYGPPFRREFLDDPQAVGVTIVKRRKPSIFEIGGDTLDRTEFSWSHKDGIKTFEVEEVSTVNHAYDCYHINRYVHSERDMRAGVLRHFDGAVKVYLKDAYSSRLASTMPHEPKCHAKLKLFRIDGCIDVNQWIELIAHFFKGNEMLLEYFDPEGFEARYGEKIRRWAESDFHKRKSK